MSTTTTFSAVPFSLLFETSQIHVVVDDQQNPWLNVNNVCAALGYSNPTKALANHVRAKDCMQHEGTDYINQNGVYSLIACAARKKAKPFMQWLIGRMGEFAAFREADRPKGQDLGKFSAEQESKAYHIAGAFSAVADLLSPVFVPQDHAFLDHVKQSGMASLMRVLSEQLGSLLQEVGFEIQG
ncbi:MAG: Bro-N domain-containing protein [Magnetococcus sp. YQC-5]